MKRKTIIFSRHGEAPPRPGGGSQDLLIPESVIRMVDRSRDQLSEEFSEQGYKLSSAFLKHTNKVKTRYTGQAILVGAFGLEPLTGEPGSIPRNQEELANYDWSQLDISEDSRLNLRDPHANMDVYNSLGAAGNIDYWLQEPGSAEHIDKPIVPYIVIQRDIAKSLEDDIESLEKGDKDLGIVVSHASIIELPIIELINSGRTSKITKTEDFGGVIEMEEYAKLTLDYKSQTSNPQASISVKGIRYKVDLTNL